MSHSFSSIKLYETCPRKYHEERVLRIHPRQETEATRWGEQVHEAAETFVRDGTEIKVEFPGADMVRALARLSGEKHCEMRLAVNEALEPVDFGADDAFIRGIADLVIIKGTKARVIDYKTGGNKYPDVSQLELMALLLFARFPEIEVSFGALLFLAHDTMVPAITKRDGALKLWSKWIGKVERIEHAHETRVWNEKPSGLCRGWCPCSTCIHWQPRREK